MVIPHYAFLVPKMLAPNGVIFIKGDIKQAYDYDRERCEMVDTLLVPSSCRILRKLLLSPSEPCNAKSEDFQVFHPAGGQAEQDSPSIPT
jgi:hypothetical protein